LDLSTPAPISRGGFRGVSPIIHLSATVGPERSFYTDLVGIQIRHFGFNAPLTKHASCRAALKTGLKSEFTHPWTAGPLSFPQVVQWFDGSRKGDPQFGHVREVRRAQPPRHVLLAEVHFLRRPLSHPMLGYDIAPRGGRLLLNSDEAQQVRAIFRLYLDYHAMLPVVREIDRRGWHTKQWVTKRGGIQGGKRFTKGRLYRLLTNPIYTGNVEFKGQVYNGEHEAIVEGETWASVQETLQRKGRSGRGS
jgi:hypothetical protein